MVTVCFCLSAVIRSRILVKSLDKGAGMARKVRDRELGDRASRAKLKPRGKPYWRTLDQGVHIGYRKNPKAGGKSPSRPTLPPPHWAGSHYLLERRRQWLSGHCATTADWPQPGGPGQRGGSMPPPEPL